ncbi:MAG: hypothetical protein R2747_10345 [Pyrinomonadaceae bacterium]
MKHAFPCFFVFLLFFSQTAFAQDKKLSAEDLEVIGQILFDAEKLEFPENRAWVFAEVAEHLWRADEVSARKLLERSLTELTAAQNGVKPPVDPRDSEYRLFYGQTPRSEIVKMISALDPELALDYLLKSRPPEISRLLEDFRARKSQTQGRAESVGFAIGEAQKERELKAQIIRQNPLRAAEFVEEDVKNGVTSQTLEFLRAVYKNDPARADQLTEKAVAQILAVKLYDAENKLTPATENDPNLIIARRFLQALGKDGRVEIYPMAVSNETLKKLAEKVLDCWESGNQKIYRYWADYKTIQRFFPDRAAVLEVAEPPRKATMRRSEDSRFNEVFKTAFSNEELLAKAEEFSPRYKSQLVKKAVCNLAGAGNFSGAAELFNARIPDSNSAKRELDNIFYAQALKAMDEKRFPFAEKVLRQISDPAVRSQSFVNLAVELYRADPANNKRAAFSLLSQVETESNGKENPSYEILVGYSVVEPEIAFQRLGPYIDQMNAATAKRISDEKRFGRKPPIRAPGSGNFLGIIPVILKELNYRKTLELINGIESPENRIAAKLALLRDKKSFSFRGAFFPRIYQRAVCGL